MDVTPLKPLARRWPGDQVVYQTLTAELHELGDSLVIDQRDSDAIAAFARSNQFTYNQRSPQPPQRTDTYKPAWLRIVMPLNEPAFVHEISGNIRGFPVVCNIEYTPAATQTKYSKTLNLAKRGIIRVSLPKVFPQLVLDSNKNDRNLTSTIPNAINASQKLTLEGDFNTYFDFYAPANLQIDALIVLAPNLMQLLKDSSAEFDVEFYGQEMILVTRDPLYAPEVMESAWKALDEQLAYLENLLRSWDYQPLNPPFDTLQYATLNGDVVKLGPLRLGPGTLILLILAFMILVPIMIFLNPMFAIIPGVLLFGWIIFAMVRKPQS